MFKTTLTAAAIVLVTAVTAQANVNCNKWYGNFLDKMQAEGSAKATVEQLAGINRNALRAYDACMSGDENFNANFLDKIQSEGSAKTFNWLDKLQSEDGSAKKENWLDKAQTDGAAKKAQ